MVILFALIVTLIIAAVQFEWKFCMWLFTSISFAAASWFGSDLAYYVCAAILLAPTVFLFFAFIRLDLSVISYIYTHRESKKNYMSKYYSEYMDAFSSWIPPDTDLWYSDTYRRLKGEFKPGDPEFRNPDTNKSLRMVIDIDCRRYMATKCAKRRTEIQLDIDDSPSAYMISEDSEVQNQEFFYPDDPMMNDPYDEMKRLSLPIRIRKA